MLLLCPGALAGVSRPHKTAAVRVAEGGTSVALKKLLDVQEFSVWGRGASRRSAIVSGVHLLPDWVMFRSTKCQVVVLVNVYSLVRGSNAGPRSSAQPLVEPQSDVVLRGCASC